MSIATAQVPIPAEVSVFAAEQGVSAELAAVMEITGQIFADARVSVALDDDPEITNERHIVVLAQGVKLPVAEAVAANWQWHRRLLSCCPAARAGIFRLGLELAE